MKNITIIAFPRSSSTAVARKLCKQYNLKGLHEPDKGLIEKVKEKANPDDKIVIKFTVDEMTLGGDQSNLYHIKNNLDTIIGPVIFLTMSPLHTLIAACRERIVSYNDFIKTSPKEDDKKIASLKSEQGKERDNASQIDFEYFHKGLKEASNMSLRWYQRMQASWDMLKPDKRMHIKREDLQKNPQAIFEDIARKMSLQATDMSLSIADVFYEDDLDREEEVDSFLNQPVGTYCILHLDESLDRTSFANKEFIKPSKKRQKDTEEDIPLESFNHPIFKKLFEEIDEDIQLLSDYICTDEDKTKIVGAILQEAQALDKKIKKEIPNFLQ